MSDAIEELEVQAGQSRNVGTRKRKWSYELDALLLREVKLHKPHEQRPGAIGGAYISMANFLNESRRLPWRTDKKHLQGRVQHLVEARRANQRATARATGIEEVHGQLEILLDDVIGEADFFKSTEVQRREVRRERDEALAEGGGLARTLAMGRQTSGNAVESDDDSEGRGVRAEPDWELVDTEAQKIGRERRSSPLVSLDAGSSNTPEGLESQGLGLLKSNVSAISSQATQQAEADSQRHRKEEEREARLRDFDNRRVDIETRRVRVEEEREARLQRSEERQAKMEELRISAQRAQTEMMLKMLEIVQKKLT
jgi:hypothetical protein